MTLRELEAERTRLCQQIASLTSITLGPDMAPVRAMAHDSPCRAFLNHLEEQLEEKKACLRELDEQIDRASAPLARFRSGSRQWMPVIWVGAALTLGCSVLAGMCSGMGVVVSALFGMVSVLLTIWALWAASFSS